MKLRILLISFLVILLVACGGAEERKQEYLERGIELFNADDDKKARVEFKNVLQIDPKHSQAYYYVGQLDVRKENWRGAFRAYQRAVEYGPENLPARVELGRLYLVSSDYEGAAEQVNAVLTREPGHVDALVLKASLKSRQGDKDAALKMVREALEKDPINSGGILLISSLLEEKEQFDEAVDILNKALESGVGDNLSVRLRLAQVTANSGRDEDAATVLHSLIKDYPDRLAYRVSLSSYYAQLDKLDEAEAVLRQAIQDDPGDSQRYLVLVDFLRQRKGMDQAITALRGFSSDNPDMYELQFSLATLYAVAENRQEALSVLQKIMDTAGQNPEGVKAKSLMARLMLEEGSIDEARVIIDEVLAVNPNDTLSLDLKGRLALLDGDYIDAISNFRTVLKDKPDSTDILSLLGVAHLRNGEPDLANVTLQRVVALKPDNLQDRIRLAGIQLLLRDFKGSTEQVKYVLEKEPANPRALLLKSDILLAQGNISELEAVLTDLKEAAPKSFDGYFRMGRLALAKGDATTAMAEFKKALSINPDSVELLAELVRAEIAGKQFQQAEDRLNAALKENADHPMARNLLGNVYYAKKDFSAAKEIFKEQIERFPQDVDAYSYLAQLYLNEKDRSSAIGIMEKGLADNPKSIRLLSLRAAQHMKDDEESLALSLFDRASTYAPSDVSVLLQKSNVLAKLKRRDELEETLRRITILAPDKPDAFLRLGILYQSEKNYKDAIAEFNRALENSPESPQILSALVGAYVVNGDVATAKSRLLAVLGQQPDHANARILLANLERSAGNNAMAIDLFKEEIDLHPERVITYIELARAQVQGGQYSAGIETYKQGLRQLPDDERLMLGLANLYESAKRYDEARAAYSKLISVAPKNVIAANNLAVLLVDQGGSAGDISRATKLTKGFGEYKEPVLKDTYAWVRYHAGDYAEAERALEQVVKDDGDNPEFRYHLGMVKHKLGKNADAKIHLTQAVNSARDFSGKDVARKTLDAL